MKYTMKSIFVIIVTVVLITAGCGKKEPPPLTAPEKPQAEGPKTQTEGPKKKVLFIDSYHRGYEWSDGVTNGILLTFKAKLNEDDTTDNSRSKVDLKIFRMNTKNNPSEEFKKASALKARDMIESWKPDIVITSDDNAFKYLIMPYYRDTDLPVVFCGLNWDASTYGAPYKNTTGMIEVALIRELIEKTQNYSNGNRVGYLSADILTERKNLEYYNNLFNISFTKTSLVATLQQWKDAFLSMQNEVDLLVFENNAGIVGWDDEQASQFALENTKIPVATTNPWIMQSALIGFTKIPEEQGEYAAKTAMKILNGISPTDIPVVSNKKAKVYLNMKIAKKLGVVFPMDLINEAELFSKKTERKN